MKKLIHTLTLSLVVFSCSESPVVDHEDALRQPALSRACASMEILEQEILADPKLRVRRENIEQFTHEIVRSGRINALGKIEIPVLVHVLYRLEDENISEEQIRSQIAVLNEDFNAKNADASQTPELFKPLIADTDLQFVLEGIDRKFSNRRSWDLSSAMKKPDKGGIAPVDPEHYLNIWVVNKILSLQTQYLGYAQFPGGNPATDGVVIGHNYFGRVGKVTPPFDRGRTTTHEVGHWLNLLHIWGDSDCGTDLVDDTPQHAMFNVGCPEHRTNSCNPDSTTLEMTMNFMDYTNDACMFLFTKGQKSRARALFGRRGARAGFAERDTL